MPDQEQTAPKPRGNPAWRPGVSGNPAGRPRSGQSLAEAFRQKFSVERIVELAERLAESAESDSVRLAALQLIAERAHGKVVTTTANLNMTAATALPANFSLMPEAEQLAVLDEIRQRSLVGGG